MSWGENIWIWLATELFFGIYVVVVLYYFFIRRYKKEQKQHEEKDSTFSK
jgi:preprotein translocase subunit YajC